MIKLNGTLIKEPVDFNITTYNLTKSGRVASGLMTMDLVAKKYKLSLTYPVLSGSDFKTILNVIDVGQMFFDVTFIDVDGTETTKTCYVGEIPRDRFRTKASGGEYWTNVKIDFIER